MRHILLFCTIGLASHSILAFSSNNTCLPVLAEAVEQLGTLNENLNVTILTMNKILIFANRVVNEIVPEVLAEYRKTVPQIKDQVASMTAEVEAIRILAEERTNAGFIIGVTIGAAFGGIVTVLMTNMSVKWAHSRWFNRDPGLPAARTVVANQAVINAAVTALVKALQDAISTNTGTSV